jgi:hypothetical protein
LERRGQLLYTHISKCKNNKIILKIKKKAWAVGKEFLHFLSSFSNVWRHGEISLKGELNFGME